MDPIVLFADMPLGLRSVHGVRETKRESVQAKVRHTWNGKARIIKPSFGRKWDIILSNEGSGVRLPDVDRLHPGALVELHSVVFWPVSLDPGETLAVLARNPSPGTVHARDAHDEERAIDCNVVGRNVTVFGRGGHTRVWYRPVFRCLVVSFEDGGELTGRSQSWQLELTEEAAP